jgi:hypothetical protein
VYMPEEAKVWASLKSEDHAGSMTDSPRSSKAA